MRRRNLPALLIFVLLAALIAILVQRYLPVTSNSGSAWVTDGDSLEIEGVRIRLRGIDAPELRQTCSDAAGRSWECGRTAQRELRAHIGGQTLRCESKGTDRFKRALAICLLPDGSDVNAWMVRQGWAVATGFSGTYRSEQDEAKAARRGIWAGTFTTPTEWRRRNPRE